MRRALLVGVVLAAGVNYTPARAANPTLNQLAPRGPVAASDQIPILPAGATTLQAATAADIANYVLTSVKAYGAVGDGVTDDTAAIQAAINSGKSVLFPPGKYKISSMLTMTSTTNHGQVLRGGGMSSQTGLGGGAATIQPTSAVSVALKIDGTPFSAYVQSAGVENLVFDMTNMADVSTSIAVDQIQAFDINYRNDRVINYGTHKISWQFLTGSYTTHLYDSQGGIVNMQGSGFQNDTTSLILENCDILQISHTYFQNVTIIGGAIQRPYSSAVSISYLAPGTTPYGYLPNTAGLYVAVMSEIAYAQQFTSVGAEWEQGGGYPSTYNDGTHGTLTLIPVLQVDATSTGTTFISPMFAGMYLLDYGVNTRVIGEDVGAAAYDIHNGQSYELGNIGSLGNIFGLTNLASYLNTLTGTTYSISGSTGAATFQQESIRPASDGDQVFTLKNAAGAIFLDFASNSPVANFYNGLSLNGYSDTGSTQGYQLDTSGLMTLKNAGATTITLTGANGHIAAVGFNGSVGDVSPNVGAFTTLSTKSEVYPGSGNASQSGGGLLAGLGNPGVGVGSNGDFYYRTDCVHAGSNCVWHKESGAWVDLN